MLAALGQILSNPNAQGFLLNMAHNMANAAGTQPMPQMPSSDMRRWATLDNVASTAAPFLAALGPAGMAASIALPLAIKALKPKQAEGKDYEIGQSIRNGEVVTSY